MKVKQFQLGGFSEIYLLDENGTMWMGELENVEGPETDPLRHSDMKVVITRQIILPNMENETLTPVENDETLEGGTNAPAVDTPEVGEGKVAE